MCIQKPISKKLRLLFSVKKEMLLFLNSASPIEDSHLKLLLESVLEDTVFLADSVMFAPLNNGTYIPNRILSSITLELSIFSYCGFYFFSSFPPYIFY